jgi:two-component system, OmpR family, response regulator CpxR
MFMKLLLIDDDTGLCELLESYLHPKGIELEAVNDGERGALLALKGSYDIVVLDVMLPSINGFEVLRRIRQSSQVPVLMLTACGDEVDRIVGLEMGADDYLTKPFNTRELLARLRVIQRRSAEVHATPDPRPSVVEVDDVAMTPGTRTVLRGGDPLRLTSLEFSILEVLLRMAGTVVTRDELTRQALGRDFRGYDRSIDIHISNLRRKLGPTTDGNERIKSVRGVGYLYGYSACPNR